ncbi:bifunctional riboflavin kinase/FAD synthetase [bacterium]|nr:bifunctional riboflavin kinase/FAD synthetase [bacterium]
MKVIYGLNKLKDKNFIITMGVFDGVHRGHQKVVYSAVKRACRLRSSCMVVTFDLHPKNIISSREKVYLLTTLKQKEKLLRKIGVDVMLVINFNKNIVNLSPGDFVRDILWKRIGSREIFIGYNFGFGCRRTGNVNDLEREAKKYNIKVRIISPFKAGNVLVSSTKIRQLLQCGKIDKANRLLGYYYRLSGMVVKGKGKGLEWNIPTANLSCSGNVILPEGVYVANVFYKAKQYQGIVNIGFRPTLYLGTGKKVVEVHIFRFNKNIYRKKVEIELIKKIRNEKKFVTKEKLIKQMIKDIEYAHNFFSKKTI